MSGQIYQRIGFDLRLNLTSKIVKCLVYDASVLHIP